MADYKAKSLRDERLLMIITATHGEGDPPDPALDFHEFLHGRKAPKLPDTKFAVLALGDSSYEHFCQTGREFDARLEALGAERLAERVECDVDYEEPAEAWLEQVLGTVAEHAQAAPDDNVIAFGASPPKAAESRHDRRNPFHAEVLDSVLLSGRGSPGETHHIELSLEGSGIDYQPGDVLGVVAENREETVAELLDALCLSGDEAVSGRSGETTLAGTLTRDHEITTLTPGFVGAWAELAGADDLRELAAEDRRSELMAYLEGRHLIDVVTEYPAAGLDAATLLGMLRSLQPREYSIASSHAANPGEVHLTVSAVRYETHGRSRQGVASTHLADRARPGETVPVYVRANRNFRLPAEPDTPILMIGPGTGVAPFRAFLQEREEQEIEGGSWLFFGAPHQRTDFLYQTEFQRWLRDGVLERMDVAFSRDGPEKVYVQHRLRERGAEVWRWLESGAHVYVCGDAEFMAPDVHRTLEGIVQEHGGRDEQAAREYLRELQREKRYQRDVY
jgi:sulfite reductase (NADPH) flavoprotein alpha-component